MLVCLHLRAKLIQGGCHGLAHPRRQHHCHPAMTERRRSYRVRYEPDMQNRVPKNRWLTRAPLPSFLDKKDAKLGERGDFFQTLCARGSPLQLLQLSLSKPVQPRSIWQRQQPRHALAPAHCPALEVWNSPARPQNLHTHFTISSSCRRAQRLSRSITGNRPRLVARRWD